MKITLRVWRQQDRAHEGRLVAYEVRDVTPDMSFLEMMDLLNDELVRRGEDVIAFDSDCREGICGSCCLHINGRPHGPLPGVATCQLHMRSFHDGDIITVEPFRAQAFPPIKDLAIDRSAFDRIVHAGGFISVRTGGTPEANTLPIAKIRIEEALDAAACISCGACVAACKNASAMLFVAAKVKHLSSLPQGEAERRERALSMVARMDAEGFGACSNTYACEYECPAKISVDAIAFLNRDLIRAKIL